MNGCLCIGRFSYHTNVSDPLLVVEVEKSRRTLRVIDILGEQSRIRHEYRIGLGSNPVGHKMRQGDGATPEGEYFITHKNPKSKFFLSLGISYPNLKDAEQGLRSRLISETTFRLIENACRSNRLPPQNTALGGDIFIHGGGSDSDWTLGCIALDNAQIKILFDLVPVGTKVRILP